MNMIALFRKSHTSNALLALCISRSRTPVWRGWSFSNCPNKSWWNMMRNEPGWKWVRKLEKNNTHTHIARTKLNPPTLDCRKFDFFFRTRGWGLCFIFYCGGDVQSVFLFTKTQFMNSAYTFAFCLLLCSSHYPKHSQTVPNCLCNNYMHPPFFLGWFMWSK